MTISSAVDNRKAEGGPLTPAMLRQVQRYWDAVNYLTIAQIYLLDNPLLREPLRRDDIKPRLLGHWGTSPGLSLIYVHLNRLINERDANVIYLTGPGHGVPALVSDRGASAELFEADTRLPLPLRLTEAAPALLRPEELQPWVDAVLRLLDDADFAA